MAFFYKEFLSMIIFTISIFVNEGESKLIKNRKIKQNRLKSFSVRRNKTIKIPVNLIISKKTILGVLLIINFFIFPLMISEEVKISAGFSGTTGTQAWSFTTGGMIKSSSAITYTRRLLKFLRWC